MMKTFACVLVLCALAFSAEAQVNVNDVTRVLTSEPESARFAEVQSCGDNCGTQTVTFTDSGVGGASAEGVSEEDDADAEFDAQIDQIKADLKKLDEELKEAGECANREKQLDSEIRQLRQQKSHLEKEKSKSKLRGKLDKQMKDLNEINRMSRALRHKFGELKRAQRLIKTAMMGTRGTLNSLESEPEMDSDDMDDAVDNLGQEIEAMHSSQDALLTGSHKRQQKDVKASVEQAQDSHSSVDTEELFD